MGQRAPLNHLSDCLLLLLILIFVLHCFLVRKLLSVLWVVVEKILVLRVFCFRLKVPAIFIFGMKLAAF